MADDLTSGWQGPAVLTSNLSKKVSSSLASDHKERQIGCELTQNTETNSQSLQSESVVVRYIRLWYVPGSLYLLRRMNRS